MPSQLIAVSPSHSQDIGFGIFIPITFVAWDYLLTFDREVKCFWSGRFTPACVLFFMTRYCSLVFNFLLMASLLVHGVSGADALSSSNCKFVRAIAGVSYFPFIPWAVLSGMRAYALSRSLFLSVVICLLSLVPFAIHFRLFLRGTAGFFVPIPQCADKTSTSIALRTWDLVLCDNVFLTISRAAAILGDFLLVVITARSIWRRPLRERFADLKRVSFARVLLWNGMIYFVVVLVWNAVDLTLALTSIESQDNTDLTVFISPVTVVLISRFLLDLREASQRRVRVYSDTDDTLRLSTHLDSGSSLSAAVVESFGPTILPEDDAREAAKGAQ
ncbi:hypothetical protein OH76DRAFT_1481550 [Lentinus brumalis]|uniref:DUF6533 domain-containing protein n=1 Tax=Lentinus brumalis TaxID=2498619 RepID=A0A371DFD0_9APHY|nr:hypothetical protein OH76DRAFT_1481550 [Polyporus brumalis]